MCDPPPGSCAAQDPELYRTYVGLGKPAAARNTDSFVGEMQTKVGTWCSQCRNQRPKNCTKAKKSEKRSTPTAADDEERSSGRKAARRERFTPGSSGSDLGGESHNLRDQSDPWRIHSVRSMEDLSGIPIAVPVAVSMAAPPASPMRQVAAPSAGASGSLSPRAMSDVRGAFRVPQAHPAAQKTTAPTSQPHSQLLGSAGKTTRRPWHQSS